MNERKKDKTTQSKIILKNKVSSVRPLVYEYANTFIARKDSRTHQPNTKTFPRKNSQEWESGISNRNKKKREKTVLNCGRKCKPHNYCLLVTTDDNTTETTQPKNRQMLFLFLSLSLSNSSLKLIFLGTKHANYCRFSFQWGNTFSHSCTNVISLLLLLLFPVISNPLSLWRNCLSYVCSFLQFPWTVLLFLVVSSIVV